MLAVYYGSWSLTRIAPQGVSPTGWSLIGRWSSTRGGSTVACYIKILKIIICLVQRWFLGPDFPFLKL